MMKIFERKGIYTGRMIAKVAHWIMENEERDLQEDGLSKERRFHNVLY